MYISECVCSFKMISICIHPKTSPVAFPLSPVVQAEDDGESSEIGDGDNSNHGETVAQELPGLPGLPGGGDPGPHGFWSTESVISLAPGRGAGQVQDGL